MGCWNETCAISNLHILSGQPVAIFMLSENPYGESYCYPHSFYNPCILPFYGVYNDYGDAEECTGLGLPIIIESFKQKLTELEEGPNKCHDIPVKRADFNVEKLWELNHEDRLFIDGKVSPEVSRECEGESALRKLPGVGKHCKAIMIHGDIFDAILNDWKEEGWNRKTRKSFKYTFDDVIDSIPEYIERTKKYLEENKCIYENENRFMIRYGLENVFPWNDDNLGVKYLRFHDLGACNLVDFPDIIIEYFNNKSDKDITELLTEIIKGEWINWFMSSTRKAWMPTIGSGGQNREQDGYKTLIKAMRSIMIEENKRANE